MHKYCHLSSLIQRQAAKYRDDKAVTYRPYGSKTWSNVSWKQMAAKVSQVSNAFIELGLKPHDKIAIFSQNCVEYLYTDFGAYGIKLISIPFYSTSSEVQLKFIINDASVKVVFVGEQEHYDKLIKVAPLCPTLDHIVVFDRQTVLKAQDTGTMYFDDFIALGAGNRHEGRIKELIRTADYNDICNILYTSGTTGDAKGVILSYKQYAAAIKGNLEKVPINEKDATINFLPYTHVFERGWVYVCLSAGTRLIINTYPKEIQQSIKETNPTCMCSVPRFWEKVYAEVQKKINSSTGMTSRLISSALEVGCQYHVDYLMQGKKPPLTLKTRYKLLDKLVLSKIRSQIGLHNPRFFPTAGATVSQEVEKFIHSIGVNMLAGYGLTESLATVTCDDITQKRTIGSVGRPINSISIKIAANNEICIKGPTVTPGYYNRPYLNREIFDSEGYFKTGDAGYIKNGELYLTDRIKDIFKTSNGKYIAPQMIESMLLVDTYIEQVAVIANERKFVSALIVPNFDSIKKVAGSRGFVTTDKEELTQNPFIHNFIMDRVDTLLQPLAKYEQVKKISLLPEPFSIEKGELTNTLKLRRQVVQQNYKAIIDKMYEE